MNELQALRSAVVGAFDRGDIKRLTGLYSALNSITADAAIYLAVLSPPEKPKLELEESRVDEQL